MVGEGVSRGEVRSDTVFLSPFVHRLYPLKQDVQQSHQLMGGRQL
jgi:hypothetical protein